MCIEREIETYQCLQSERPLQKHALRLSNPSPAKYLR